MNFYRFLAKSLLNLTKLKCGVIFTSLVVNLNASASELPKGNVSKQQGMVSTTIQATATDQQKEQDQMTAVWADVAKGQFTERGDVSVDVSSETLIREWNANEIFKEWEIEGFKLVNKKGINTLTSGDYPSGAFMSAKSKEIDLPKVRKGELLFVQLDHSVEVESYYDEVSVYVLTDGGKFHHKVYACSGKLKNGVETSFDVTKFAGRKVQFRLVVTADESIEGKGWDIRNFTLLTGKDRIYEEKVEKPLSALRAGSREVSLNLRNVGIGTDGKGQADIFFDNDELYEEYKQNEDQLTITVNGQKAGCLKFFKTGEKDNVNIVYAIDNSGSMGTYQSNVAESVPDLITYSTEKFSSVAALRRFGQNSTGCSLYEENKSTGKNTFNLDNELDYFVRDIWKTNVQSGSTEQYYAVLKKVARTPFQKVEGKQLVIVMMGDESITNGDNSGDCDGGTAGFTEADQEKVANYLVEKGAMVFVIQRSDYKSEYQTIVNKTGGAFIDIESNYKEIADIIYSKLKNHYKVSFCIQSSYECGQTVLVDADWDGTKANTETTVNGDVSVKRDSKTELLSNIHVNTPVTLSFDISADAECINLKKGIFRYVYSDSIVEKNCNIENGKLNYTIPAEHVIGDKIKYYVLLDIEENGIQIGNPYVTHASWAWELGIENDRPKFSNVDIDNKYSCQERNFSVNISDKDGINSAMLYYKTSLDAAWNSPIQLSKSTGNQFSTLLDKNIGNGQGFYYYLIATDNLGLEANYGEASAPLFMKFEVPENTDNNNKSALSFNDSKRNNCKKLDDGETGTFYFYAKNDCEDLILISEQEIIGNRDNLYKVNIPHDNNPDTKNGVELNDEVFVHFVYGDDKDKVEYNVTSFTYGTDKKIQVCVPDIAKNFTLTKSEVTHTRSMAPGDTVHYGDTVNFGKCADDAYIKFFVPNDYYTPIVLNEIRITGGGNCFVKESDIENVLINPDETKTFNIVYRPNGNEFSEVKIYNSTRDENPFIFYIKGEADETEICKRMCASVSLYDNNFVANVRTSENLSDVTLAVVGTDGDTLRSVTMPMGGPATQGISLSTIGMDKNKEYSLYVKVGDRVCSNAFIFNEKSSVSFDSTATENCNELIKNLSVNSWGSMVEVPVHENNAMVDLSVYSISGTKTDVHFGPQTMGGPTTHSLYLGTNALPAGSYILRAKVGDKTCSQSFVNVK